MRVLNVAEKNSVAREICNQLGGQAVRPIQGRNQSQFIASFDYSFARGGLAKMTVTAVRGHLMALDFPRELNSWNAVDPSALFTAPVVQSVQHADLARTLARLARESDWLILWLDCDREGEAIAFEVLEVCLKANRTLRVFRARFSALTFAQLSHAIENLVEPNRNQAEAVLARSEMDLRIGAAFTRFLTLRFRHTANDKQIISFGGCQTVTLGFVVSRWLLRERFIPEHFWYLDLTSRFFSGNLILKWNRHRLFDQDSVCALHSLCGTHTGKVVKFSQEVKSKWRPLPLNTLEMTKIASTKLRIPSHQVMSLAESLYARGLISYPRTETDSFSPSINLRQLVALQSGHSEWGSFAQRLLDGAFTAPRRGKRDDQAHPPIHPLKSAEKSSDFSSPDEFKIYQLVTRHFLACCAPDAIGSGTHLEVQVACEIFHADGLTVIEKNWLQVYPYATWSSSEANIPQLRVGDPIAVASLSVRQGTTEAPCALSESELLSLMDKEGIGTDATMHEHVKTVQERGYCFIDPVHRWFEPTSLGIALILGLAAYEGLGYHLGKPELRAGMEADLTRICNGEITRTAFLQTYCAKMKQIFLAICDNPSFLDSQVRARRPEPPRPRPRPRPKRRHNRR